ncbi:MAG TPA: ABC transporter permease [Bacteroidales bacterium]|nr:ABC transporter permease [Bacteroidales bacterium]
MKKILLIIRREYLTRVRKRSFVVMTILGPLLMAALVIVPIYVATMSNEKKSIAVIDETGLFFEKFKDADNIHFHYLVSDIGTAKENFSKADDYAILYIPKTELSLPMNAILYSSKQININVDSYIKSVMSKTVEELKLEAKLRDLPLPADKKITPDDILKSIKSSVNITTIKIGGQGKEEKSYPEVTFVLGLFSSIMIYFFIFMFGAQVMRGVIEEKTSRIIEVIISSVKPFELMMGKIIGVALVGLTQFLLWVVLTFSIVTVVTSTFSGKITSKSVTEQAIGSRMPGMTAGQVQPAGNLTRQENQGGVNEVLDAIDSIDFPLMICSFIFFFLFGYLMYAALFAAIGSAVDSEADTQQFMLPITIPLIFSIIMAQYVVQNPEGQLSVWLSMIPLTSPVIMMIRIPFGVSYLEMAASMFLLILGFLGATWLAAKVYRTGILMYGKKVSYREMWKWIRYRG